MNIGAKFLATPVMIDTVKNLLSRPRDSERPERAMLWTFTYKR
jgi:hypothetical protein